MSIRFGASDNGTSSAPYSTTLGDGTAKTFTVAHNKNAAVVASVYDNGTGEVVFPTVTKVDTNALSLTFATAPTVGQYTVVVI